VDALLKLCHDAMARSVSAAPRYFPAERLPVYGSLPALRAWERELHRVARHDDHPWNEGLLLESLVAQGRIALRASPGDPARSAAPGDTLVT
jgi:DNA polymerase-3 subunit delta'